MIVGIVYFISSPPNYGVLKLGRYLEGMNGLVSLVCPGKFGFVCIRKVSSLTRNFALASLIITRHLNILQ
jgi:hypothetical protein